MKRKVLLSVLLLCALLALAGCAAQSSQQSTDQRSEAEMKAYFIGKLTQNDWAVSVKDYEGTLRFDAQGTGVVELNNGKKVSFKYTLTDLRSNGEAANIQVSDTGISQADGRSVQAGFNSSGELQLNYSVMSLTLKPTSN